MLDLLLGFGQSGVAANGPLTRNIIQTNGVDQYATFANAIVGDGVGEIVLKVKLSNTGLNQYLLDGDVSGSRLYWLHNDNTSWTAPAGVSVVVDGEVQVATSLEGEEQEFKITGDLTGLRLGTLFARYNLTELAKCQPISLAYKDQSQEFSLSFDNGLGYEVIGEPGRDLVIQNATTTWDGTEAAWTSKILGINAEAGKTYLITETISEGSTGAVKAQVGSVGGAYPTTTSVTRTHISTPDAGFSMQVQTDGTFIGTVTVEIREIPNALIWQNYSAAQWATYVQQPNGDWLLKGSDPAEYVVLSDYQRNQFYIEQAEKAIAGYKAKDTKPYLVDMDGMDDELGSLLLAPFTGKVRAGCRCSNEVSGDIGDILRVGSVLVLRDTGNRIRVYPDVVANDTAYFLSGHIASSGVIQSVDLEVTEGSTQAVIFLDGVRQDITLPGNANLSSGRVSFGPSDYNFHQGYTYAGYVLDHTAPLPIGQGGNSVFLPMNKAGDTVANVLGLDNKGNVIAKDGAGTAGHATWQGDPVGEQYTYDKVSGALVGTTQTLYLSPELQRQHDLAIVEAKFAKWDKAFSKSMALREFDGLDDGVSLSTLLVATDGFKLTVPLNHASIALGVVLGLSTAADSYISVDQNGTLTVQINTVSKAWPAGAWADDSLAYVVIEREQGSSVVDITPSDGATQTVADGNAISFDAVGYNSLGNRFAGRVGYASWLDLATPLSSQYLTQAPEGMTDLMGNGGGIKHGDPADPKAFIKTGDDWYHADSDTTILGS